MFSLFGFGKRREGRESNAPAPKAQGRIDPADRMLDVAGMLRQASSNVSIDQLIKSGKKQIQLLSRERIQELINRSVRTIVEKHIADSKMETLSAEQIARESKAEFQELLDQYQQTTRAREDVERSRQTLDEELERLREELEREKAEAEARKAEAPDGDADPDPVRVLNVQMDRLFEARRKLAQRKGSPEAAEEVRQVEETLRSLVARAVAPEVSEDAVVLSRENAVLHKRIEKLNEYVASLEKALKTLSNTKLLSNQQVQNVLRQLGLAQEDKYFEKKKEALKLVLEANQSVRKQAKELESKGITLSNPRGNVPAPAREPVPVAAASMDWVRDSDST